MQDTKHQLVLPILPWPFIPEAYRQIKNSVYREKVKTACSLWLLGIGEENTLLPSKSLKSFSVPWTCTWAYSRFPELKFLAILTLSACTFTQGETGFSLVSPSSLQCTLSGKCSTFLCCHSPWNKFWSPHWPMKITLLFSFLNDPPGIDRYGKRKTGRFLQVVNDGIWKTTRRQLDFLSWAHPWKTEWRRQIAVTK